jgi:hypothetical protein
MAAALIPSIINVLATDSNIPVPFIEVIPAGAISTPPTPAVVIEDLGTANNKYLTSSTLPNNCHHTVKIKIYSTEENTAATQTLDLAKRVADVLTPTSLTITGSTNPKIFRGDGFLQLQLVKEPEVSGRAVYLCTLVYEAVYSPPW